MGARWIHDLEAGELHIAATCGPATAGSSQTPQTVVRLAWSGRSTVRTQGGALAPYLGRILEAAAALGAALELDFRGLDGLDSSTLVLIVRLVQQARAAGVPLVLRHDPRRLHQRHSFEALRTFLGECPLVEVCAS